ncbi:MAG TPA: hypothetical protein P5531_02735 [Bacteroidales bacterium]|nr:hypothetical protein [Bacteroidales bacterium]HSA44883.1 hypothetical protein [Bacteroidales bacterium]
MKKFIYFSGVISLIIFLCGDIMKINHWPGANLTVSGGLGSFAVLFLPLAVHAAWRTNGKRHLPLYLAGLTSIFINVVAAMFKICHYPGASILLLTAIPLPFMLFLPVFLYYHVKGDAIPLKSFLGVMFLLLYMVVFSALLAVGTGQ